MDAKKPLTNFVSDNVVSYVVLHGLSQGLNNVGAYNRLNKL